MGFLSVIRRWALRDKMPIREIVRRTGLSRNTIRKYLREGAAEPAFKTPSRPSKLDPYADRLSAWLLIRTRKSRKERRTVKQMHADLVKLGYDGSYERVAAFARAWRDEGVVQNRRQGAAPLFHWCSSQAKLSSLIGAKTGPILEANGSRLRWPISSCRTAGPSWCGPIIRCKPTRCCLTPTGMLSASLVGCPGHGIYDNMKTAVDRVGKGKQRNINARFKAMASHYVFEPECCNPAAGWEKGKVEKNVQDARNRLWQVMPVFQDLVELNKWLEDRCLNWSK